MSTTVNTGNVGQVGQISPTIKSNPKVVTGDSSAAFQPETQVELESSLKSMLASLERSSSGKGMQQGLPAEVKQMVETLMKNAFSLDMSLSQGLTDVMQSQKFSLEQLSVLSKLLDQIGTLAESGDNAKLADALKILLGNLDLRFSADGKLLDGMMLNKLAFQLLEGKNFAELPESLQFLLMNHTAALPVNTSQSTELNFLKQLVQFFMPSSAETDGLPEQPNMPKNPDNAGKGQTPQGNGNQAASPQQGAKLPNAPQAGAQQTTAASPSSPQTGAQQTTAASPSSPQTGAQQTTVASPSSPQTGAQQQGNAASSQNNIQAQGNKAEGNSQSIPGANTSDAQSQSGKNAANQTGKTNDQQKISGGDKNSLRSAAAQAENQTTAHASGRDKPVMQNTEQMVQLLKNMAGQLVKGDALGDHEVSLLRNFINGGQKALGEQDEKQLQTLIRLSEENIPAAVRQAAMKQDLPNLPKLWAFVQLCNLTRLLDLQTERLRKASKDVNDLATVLKKSMSNENEVNGNQRSMSFMTPLYLGDNEKYYPTYVHIYHESAGAEDEQEEKRETWLRLCLLTENIGAVEIVFRLFEKNNINLRVAFSEQETVESFYDYIPDLRQSFEKLPLVLNDVKVSAIGG